jgi:hypothetical protein
MKRLRSRCASQEPDRRHQHVVDERGDDFPKTAPMTRATARSRTFPRITKAPPSAWRLRSDWQFHADRDRGGAASGVPVVAITPCRGRRGMAGRTRRARRVCRGRAIDRLDRGLVHGTVPRRPSRGRIVRRRRSSTRRTQPRSPTTLSWSSRFRARGRRSGSVLAARRRLCPPPEAFTRLRDRRRLPAPPLRWRPARCTDDRAP